VWEITVAASRRDPDTGRYGQVSRTVRTAPSRPGAKGYPKVVEAEAAKLLGEVEDGRHQVGRPTLSELLDEYRRHQQARGRAPKTLLEARRRARDIEADEIGGRDIRRLTGRDLDEFYVRLAAAGGRCGRGRHTTTRHHCHSLIRAALNQAIRWRWLSPPDQAAARLLGELMQAQKVFGHRDLVAGRGLVVLEALGEIIGMVEDVLYGAGHHCHLKNFWRAGMAWRMNSIPSAVAVPISRSRPGASAPISMVNSSNSKTRIGLR
jgi:hypothetical protein